MAPDHQILVKYTYTRKIHMIHITYFHKRESVGLKYSNDSESLIEYPNNMVDINKNTDE